MRNWHTLTDEQKQEHYRRAAELRELKKSGGTARLTGRKPISYPGFKVIIESFDKWYTSSFCVEIKISVEYEQRTDEYLDALLDLEKEIRYWFKNWVPLQEEYEKKYICIPDSKQHITNAHYVGKKKTVSVSLTFKQKRTTEFKETIAIFKPKLDEIISSLTSMVEKTGLKLHIKNGNQNS